MKKTIQRLLTMGTFTVCLAAPGFASADEGNLLEPVTVGEGEYAVTFEPGEVVTWSSSTEDSYFIEVEHLSYPVDKDKVLQTTETVKKETVVKEGVPFFKTRSLMPEFLGMTEGTETIVEQADGWVKVNQENGLLGWMPETSLETKELTEPVATKAWTTSYALLPFASELEVHGFDGERFDVTLSGTTYRLLPASITFEEPDVTLSGTTYRLLPASITFEEPGDFATLFANAKAQLGKPYVWGGNGEVGYDCSGFTTEMFKTIGITLPRTAATQAPLGVQVTKSELVPGDLLFFTTYKPGPSHVAIYIGNGQMIHAAGKEVQIGPVDSPYWNQRYLFSKRIMN